MSLVGRMVTRADFMKNGWKSVNLWGNHLKKDWSWQTDRNPYYGGPQEKDTRKRYVDTSTSIYRRTINLSFYGSKVVCPYLENNTTFLSNCPILSYQFQECVSLHLDLQDFGLTLVDDMPSDRESLRELMHRVGCIRSTHYGDIFHVIVKANANNLAYLPVTLGLHADLPYYGYNPGVMLSLSWLIHYKYATCTLFSTYLIPNELLKAFICPFRLSFYTA